MLLVKLVYELTEFFYWLVGLPINIFATPIRHLRAGIDSCLDPLFVVTKPLSCMANMASGWIYNLYHGTLGLPQTALCEIITTIPHWKAYNWMKWCTESRLCLIISFIYKTISRIFLLIPCAGWLGWIVTLPIFYMLKLWGIWIMVCPVRNLEAGLAPTSFPTKPSSCGLYPFPL